MSCKVEIMKDYREQDLIHLAKRFNNNKRNFLLVNPLQGKHIPVSPNKTIEMMKVLSDKVSSKYPNVKLVIGFAETATAIGYMVAKGLGDDCNYITTSRETLEGSYFEFKEEHSHAVDQKLYDENLENLLALTDEIILVDDELTTGKTIVNFVSQLKEKYPVINDKKIIAVSIINRLSEENKEQLENKGVHCEYLIKPKNADYEKIVEDFDISAQVDYFENTTINLIEFSKIEVSKFKKSFIKGVNIASYNQDCEDIANEAINKIKDKLQKNDNILILGTEEFMYQGIALGSLIENQKIVNSVSFHATTRSPIGVCSSDIYPVKNGFKLNSFYEVERPTYIYNIKNYDKVIIFTDSNSESATEIALCKLTSILNSFGNEKIIFIKGGFDV